MPTGDLSLSQWSNLGELNPELSKPLEMHRAHAQDQWCGTTFLGARRVRLAVYVFLGNMAHTWFKLYPQSHSHGPHRRHTHTHTHTHTHAIPFDSL